MSPFSRGMLSLISDSLIFHRIKSIRKKLEIDGLQQIVGDCLRT